MARTKAQRFVWVIAAVIVAFALWRLTISPHVVVGSIRVKCQSPVGDMMHPAQALPPAAADSCHRAKVDLMDQAGIIAGAAIVANIVVQGVLRLQKEHRQNS